MLTTTRPLLLLLLLLLLAAAAVRSIRVLESQVLLGDDREGVAVSGARLDPGQRIPAKVTDLTVCTRFKMKRIGGHEGNSILWAISDAKTGKEGREFT